MPFNLPTALTWLRIVLIPVFVAIYYLPDDWGSPSTRNWTAMWVFAVAAITDWLDGWLARRWGQTSAFGAFLDPVADKLIEVANYYGFDGWFINQETAGGNAATATAMKDSGPGRQKAEGVFMAGARFDVGRCCGSYRQRWRPT